jgi:ParB family protein of integrating conjugative element (PFGI_1 class)
VSNRNPPPNLGELLLQPNFGQSRPLDKPGDPIVPTQLLLDVTKIRRYEQDPRQHANSQFEEIKVSILAQGGINNPLTVTRRPGEEHYIIEAGGNTRLRALQELWDETGDDRFHYTHVLYKPWESESQILTRHLIENELRGEMLFVDKARGLEALRRQWAAESGLDDLSRGEFQRRLKAAGFAISGRAIIRLRFMAQIAPSLAEATADPSFGVEVVDRIMALHGAARRCWADNALLEEEFPTAWDRALTESDSTEFSLVALQHNLACILSEWITGKDAGDISLELDCLIHERRGEPASETLPPSPPVTASTGALAEIEAYPEDPAPDAQSGTHTGWREADPGEPEPAPWLGEPDSTETESPALVGVDPGKGRTDAPRGEFGPGAIPSPIPMNDLKSLKARAYVLAQRIAQHYRMGPIIAPAPQTHFGFFLTDIPHNVDETPQHIPIGQVWWLLYGLCHQEDIDAALLDRLAPADSEFRLIAPSCDPLELAGILLDKAPPLSGPRFMRAISTVEGRELQDIIDLMATYRELRVHFLRDREGRRQ